MTSKKLTGCLLTALVKPKPRISFEARRDVILDAALVVFADKGISATTKELASAAGVSEALLYKHFKSKEELFSEVQNRCCSQVHRHAGQIQHIKSSFERVAVSVLLLNHSVLIGFEEDNISKEQTHKLILQSLSSKGEFAVQMFSNFERWIPFIAGDMQICRDEDYLQKSPSTDERLLWMVHHFVLGIAMTRLPETHLPVFDIDLKKLVYETSIQSMVMLGASSAMAQTVIDSIYSNNEQIEIFNFLKG